MCKIMLLCQSSQQHLVIDFWLSILDNKWELNYNLTSHLKYLKINKQIHKNPSEMIALICRCLFINHLTFFEIVDLERVE